MRTSTLILACAALALACSALVLAAPPAPPAGGAGTPPAPMAYDASQEQTLQGQVVTLKADTRGPRRMVVLTFTTEAATWKVLAGPQDLLRRQGLSLAAGDTLTLVGVPVAVPDGKGFLARQITRDGTTATLLDANGRPAGGPAEGAPGQPDGSGQPGAPDGAPPS